MAELDPTRLTGEELELLVEHMDDLEDEDVNEELADLFEWAWPTIHAQNS